MDSANAGCGRCAHGDCPGEDGPAVETLRPGARVRLRDHPEHPARTVVGVVVEEHQNGTFTTRYRLGWVEDLGPFGPVERTFLVDAALVVAAPADETAAAAALESLRTMGWAVTDPGVEVRVRDGAVVGCAAEPRLLWVQVAGSAIRSADGRFEVGAERDGTLSARDTWTGEGAAGLTTQAAAQEWCRGRLDGKTLAWDRASAVLWLSGERADAGVQFQVYRSLGGWVGADMRFNALALASKLALSPLFVTPDEAKGWCAIRAACVVEGPEGGPQTLRYREPIPF